MKIIILSALLCTASLSLASQSNISTQPKAQTIKLPSAKILHDLLNSANVEHATFTTKIIEMMADQEICPATIVDIVDLATHLYITSAATSAQIPSIFLLRKKIIETLFKDFPEILKELTEKKVYISHSLF